MVPAIGDILPFAVGVALSPVQIIAVIMILFTPQARTNGPAFGAGWLLGLLVTGGIVIALSDAGDVSSDDSASDLANAVKLLLGMLLLFGAARQWQNRPSAGEEAGMPSWMASLDTLSLGKAFGLGTLSSTVNPKILALTLAAGVSVAQAGLDAGESFIVLAAYIVLASVTVVGPILYSLLGGASAERTLSDSKDWLMANKEAVTAVVFLVFGAVLIGQGICGLAA